MVGLFLVRTMYTFTERFDVQDRSEGCLLLYTYPSEFSGVFTFRMRRIPLSVSMPLLWIGSSPSSFYKIIKGSDSLIKKIEGKTDYIYLEDILLMARSKEEFINGDTLIFSQLIATLSTLSSKVLEVLPPPLQYRYLQKQQINELIASGTYEEQMALSPEARAYHIDLWNYLSHINRSPLLQNTCQAAWMWKRTSSPEIRETRSNGY